jgi:1-deoxyxylulose-5-phosphate synthase
VIPKAIVPGTDKNVSLLVMGCVMSPNSYDDMVAVYDRFAELGGNILDMSHCYGQGFCAQALGRWFKERKIGHEMMMFEKGCHPYEEIRVTPEHMRGDLEVELEALGREKVEFWTFHRDDRNAPIEPLVAQAAELVQQGKVDHFGGSNWLVDRLQEWNAVAAKGHGPAMTHNNPNLSLATVNEPMWEDCHTITGEEKAWHQDTQFPLFSWSSTGGGWFAGVDSPDVNRVYKNDVNEGRRERAVSLGKELGLSPVQVALAYTLSQPFPVWALVGPRTPAEMDQLAKAASVRLTADQMTWLEHGDPA